MATPLPRHMFRLRGQGYDRSPCSRACRCRRSFAFSFGARSRSSCSGSGSRSSRSSSRRSCRAIRSPRISGEQAAADPEVVQAFREQVRPRRPPARPVLDVPHQPAPRRPRRLAPDQRAGADESRDVRFRRPWSLRCSPRSSPCLSASPSGSSPPYAATASPTTRCGSSRSPGISMPTFWIALVALYVFFFRLGWFPGGDRLDPGVLAPPHKTGMYTVDALLAGQWCVALDALHHLILPALVLAAFNVAPAHALHAIRRARGARQRLRPRRAGEGAAGVERAHPPRPPRGAARPS